MLKLKKYAMFALALCALAAVPVMADEVAEVTAADAFAAADNALFTANNVWMMVATFLVFIMHLGFAMVETGLTRAKNSVNILFKNTAIPAIGLLTYALIGFNLMYPGFAEDSAGIFGFAGFGISSPEGAAGLIDYAGGGYAYWTDFLFQGMFAATAATIVSGAVAGRVKLGPFLIFSTIYVGLVYPWVGSWKWGGGWLDGIGFYDFAGSTLVHSVGGWGALAGIILLGPRLGKYVNGKVKAIQGHNMPLLTIGVFLLWLGWFGFNGGSVLSADPGLVSYVLVTTSLAAAAGIIGSMAASWTLQKHPDLTMVLNGCLAGLVGITAGADVLSVPWAVVVGLVCGAVAVVSVMVFDRFKLDDPVGATTVHLVCGILGTLFVALSPEHTIVPQLIGIVSYAVVCFPAAFILFLILKVTVGIRVSKEEEMKGLDLGEHGMEAYHGFQFFTNV
ncbi:ammonium transporter [Pontiella agarivorans]|uniref:Ammonium transporter n=1 Tax=Pontiella agarivorans TaxID=3038953 RepID=A0ABU5MWU3_9BACT|nr:ammonium transporter [Pontiella agarivorans]MDZ8118689.1 ammonium transporter [Pontiella agarivorans]